MMTQIKQEIKNLLLKKDHAQVISLCRDDTYRWKILRSCLYDADERICWAAVEAIGKLAQIWWKDGKKDRVREFMRNLFWSMNDESGGIGWFSPQTIAEIILNIPELIAPYGSMMLYHALEEPPLVKGGLWGIGRLGRRLKEDVAFFEDKVLGVFQSDDPKVLGLAAWAMGEVGFAPALPYLEKLTGRPEKVRIYLDNFCAKSLGEWAKEAKNKIKEGNKIFESFNQIETIK